MICDLRALGSLGGIALVLLVGAGGCSSITDKFTKSECTRGSDCESGVCDTEAKACAAPSCTDGVRNGAETDVDCGGGECGGCAMGLGCLAHSDCQQGGCAPATNICSICRAGDRRCSGNTPQLCDEKGLWQNDGTCEYACVGGNCTGACVPNSMQCSGTVAQTCDIAGVWQSGPDCQYVCSAGSCTGKCKPNSKQCAGQDAQTCDSTGWSWKTSSVCPYGCAEGNCSGDCVPGSKRCSGTVAETCDATGQWQNESTCPYLCSAGNCTGQCVPGSGRCDGGNPKVPQTCSAAGAWVNGAACALLCNGGNCAPVAAMVETPSGHIDATEVTQAEYKAWIDTVPATTGQPAYCYWNTSYTPQADWSPSTKGDYPVVGVDWCDAYAYCKGVGKRLCGKIGGGSNLDADYADPAKSQWMNACSSGGQNDYPYGATYAGTTCNGVDAPAQATVPVAAMTGCQSSVAGYTGVYDLSGNVYEWEDSCDGVTGQTDFCRLRGGAFYVNSANLRCGVDVGHYRDARDDGFGFRCCAP